MIGTRRLSRELALQVLFQQEFAPQQSVEDGLATFRRSFDAEPDVWAYALEILQGIEREQSAIDGCIQKAAVNWTLKRMALVDLNIMRIATYELKYGTESIPHAVAIDEAIEISRQWSVNAA